jgi:hypothetical protein
MQLPARLCNCADGAAPATYLSITNSKLVQLPRSAMAHLERNPDKGLRNLSCYYEVSSDSSISDAPNALFQKAIASAHLMK